MAKPVKKVVDSWKSKKWYSILAPNFLNNIEAAQVPALDDETLMNRIIEIPLKEITKDLSHMYTTVRLRVAEIKGNKAYAKFIGHRIAREYLRTLIRRRRDVIEVVYPCTSKDGIEFRVKVMVVSQGKISQEHKNQIRNVLGKEITELASSADFGKFVQDVLYTRLNQGIHKKLHAIAPIRRVEIWKTELKEEFDTEKPGEENAAEDKEAKPEKAVEAVVA
ncbi:hypothetical protein AUJ14_04355 [Candidatus Micrarchaeota archaeon CG1_02_55_22]|nr:MAG: hypothetical protein AUJ14_04355 [Candidatus Micrarchaeota archaeon CG1_02_55_22]